MNNSSQDDSREIEKPKTSVAVVLSSSGGVSEEKAEKPDKEKRENEVRNMESTGNHKFDRECRKFRVRYNSGIGNIMRNYMSLIYSILILRMNLVKFIFEQFPDKNRQLSQQILLENKIMYHMIRKAQHFSQEKTLYLWTHLESLINNRMILKNNLNAGRKKTFPYKDWKGMAAKLSLMKEEFNKVQNLFDSLKQERTQKEKVLETKVESLENLSRSKDELMEQLLEQVMELKKKELESSYQIFNHLKTFRDFNMRKKRLFNMEKELKQLRSEQNQLMKDLSSKVKALKLGIQDKDNKIKSEKGERKMLRKALKEYDCFLQNLDGAQKAVVES